MPLAPGIAEENSKRCNGLRFYVMNGLPNGSVPERSHSFHCSITLIGPMSPTGSQHSSSILLQQITLASSICITAPSAFSTIPRGSYSITCFTPYAPFWHRRSPSPPPQPFQLSRKAPTQSLAHVLQLSMQSDNPAFPNPAEIPEHMQDLQMR